MAALLPALRQARRRPLLQQQLWQPRGRLQTPSLQRERRTEYTYMRVSQHTCCCRRSDDSGPHNRRAFSKQRGFVIIIEMKPERLASRHVETKAETRDGRAHRLKSSSFLSAAVVPRSAPSASAGEAPPAPHSTS